ncbi:unnamed protein product, partial [Rotaria socialis]
HPYWVFLSQLSNRTTPGTLPLHSSLIFLSKMSQLWQQAQQAQTSPSIPTENDNGSDEDADIDTSSIHNDNEIDFEEKDDD